MIRPIELRFWNKEKGEMYEEAYMNTSNQDPKTAREGINKTLFNLSAVYEVMQYTGLQDKNGTKIFEGDIITYYGVPKKIIKKEFLAVHKKLHKGGVPFIVKILNTLTVDMMSFDEQCHNDISTFDFSKVEVIGDIYRNPELVTYSL